MQFFNISTSKSGPNLMCFAHFHFKMCFSPQRRAIFQHLNFKKWSEADVFCRVLCIFTSKCASRLSGVQFFNISTSKSGPKLRVLCIFTSKCASRLSGVQFFNISTSKSGPNLMCFAHFHFKMCFSPQRRAIFQHLNFKKWSEADVFCRVLCIFTSKCASRLSGVQFFNISTSKSGPKLTCFVVFCAFSLQNVLLLFFFCSMLLG